MTCANRLSLHRRLPPQVFWILFVACSLATPIAYLLLDEPVFGWQVQRSGVEFSNVWIDAFRLLGKAWLPIWLLLIWVAITGRWRRPFVSLLALLILAAPLNATKLLVGRARPREKIDAVQTPTETTQNARFQVSFPSGDTASAVTVAVALGANLAWPWAMLALVAVGGVGVMRVADLAHYPSDVLAGAALGILTALAALRLAHRLSPPAIELWGRPFAIAATIGTPIVIIFTHGIDVFFLLFQSYVPLAIAVYLVARVRRLPSRSPSNHRS